MNIKKATAFNHRSLPHRYHPFRLCIIVLTCCLGIGAIIVLIILLPSIVPNYVPAGCYDKVNALDKSLNIQAAGTVLSQKNYNDSQYGNCIEPYTDTTFSVKSQAIAKSISVSAINAGFVKQTTPMQGSIVEYDRATDKATIVIYEEPRDTLVRLRLP